MPVRIPSSLAYRSLPTHSANLLPPFASLPSQAPFSTSSSVRVHKDLNKDHVLDSDHQLNAQTDASHSGRKEAASDKSSSKDDKKHSSATSQQDVRKGGEKAKEEFPEAPDTGGKGRVMGMQDERGGVS
ncbi:MAG: hypothetical protein MMC23_002908 [Stictis urceolatum]|nr:hypothetical protein [Stictis urceolata]